AQAPVRIEASLPRVGAAAAEVSLNVRVARQKRLYRRAARIEEDDRIRRNGRLPDDRVALEGAVIANHRSARKGGGDEQERGNQHASIERPKPGDVAVRAVTPAGDVPLVRHPTQLDPRAAREL